MLLNLYIENIAVAKKLDISFDSGFTVMTGKTGAGKSVIIDSMLLLCGAKAGRELIRTGEEKATVTGLFSCSKETSEALSRVLGDQGLEPDENGEIQLQRTISQDGRSTARLNGRSIPLALLRQAAPVLMEIQTQGERDEYADRQTYGPILDIYGGSEELLRKYGEKYAVYLSARSRRDELEQSLSEKEMMLDILRYQKKEIDQAKLSDENEEAKLDILRNKLRSAEKISKYTSVINRALLYSEKGSTATYLIERAEAALEQLCDVLENGEELLERLRNCRIEVGDIAETVCGALESDVRGDPSQKLEQVENRLAVIDRLKRKYGGSVGEIIKKRSDITKKISDLEDGDFRLAELNRELDQAEAEACAAAEEISAKRRESGSRFTEELIGSLRQLDMPKVRFRVSVEQPMENGHHVLHPDGYDDVDFLISVNTGEDLQSVGRVSSGGELSRITLAIKTALAGKNDSETIVFDEIDTGVSGGTSERIGMMLKALSKDLQIIAVTHSSQVASTADHHLLIEKREEDGRTESSVREIEGEDRIAEIARIIGGINVTEKQTAAAVEMLGKNSKE
ncbi:MAG: DNA repair protein RecN [Clostridia bacterium]|nr:DNA repair protein RecN [Clostridia bacterium]